MANTTAVWMTMNLRILSMATYTSSSKWSKMVQLDVGRVKNCRVYVERTLLLRETYYMIKYL